MVLPRLDETGLRALAAAGGGSYQRLSIDDGDLRGLLAGLENHRLDQAEQVAGKAGQRWREEGVWLLWPLVLLAALAFRRGWLLLLVLMMLPVPAQALSWTDLWQRPDQQAAAAFAEGNFAQAGKMFQDPRWKASALYREGDYQAAAETLRQSENVDDWYNKGNALARGGQLPQALEAYRQALEKDPDHADARSNKKVVEEALGQQQQQKEQKSGDPSEDGQQGQNSPDSKESSSSPMSDGESSQPSGDSPPQADRSPADLDQDGKEPAAAKGEPNSAETKDSKGARNATPHPEGAGREAKEQDRARDAAAATASDEALSEEERQAVQQWLQQIPDDPGGLLRRKFLYQYRQRGRQLETDRPW
jgi:Ca-activated chloride channel family protein